MKQKARCSAASRLDKNVTDSVLDQVVLYVGHNAPGIWLHITVGCPTFFFGRRKDWRRDKKAKTAAISSICFVRKTTMNDDPFHCGKDLLMQRYCVIAHPSFPLQQAFCTSRVERNNTKAQGT